MSVLEYRDSGSDASLGQAFFVDKGAVMLSKENLLVESRSF